MKKNTDNILLRRNDILKEYIKKGNKSMKSFVIEQSDRFRLSRATIWNDIKSFRNKIKLKL